MNSQSYCAALIVSPLTTGDGLNLGAFLREFAAPHASGKSEFYMNDFSDKAE